VRAAAGALRPHVPAALGAAVGVAVMCWLGLIGFAWTDYDDEASRAFKALAEGHVGRFLELCPAYGGSMVLRAPFALLPNVWGGGELAIFRAVSLPCLIAAALFALWLVARLRGLGVGALARGTALGLVVAGPLTLRALDIGHPEELLVATLCVAAVLAARGGRGWWAALFLGVAVGCKPWALIAAGPVLAALPGRRVRAALVAALVAAALVAPIALGAATTFRATTGGLAHTGAIFQPWQAWWWLGDPDGVVRGLDNQVKVGYRAAPAWIDTVSHPLVVIAAFALTALWWWRRAGRRAPGDELLLLALVLHVRCLLDTWNTDYYALGVVFALTAWETLDRRRAPVLALALSVAAYFSIYWLRYHVTPDELSAIYLAWAVPLAALLAERLYGAPRLVRRASTPAPSGSALAAGRPI
jgi:hypothetical protein